MDVQPSWESSEATPLRRAADAANGRPEALQMERGVRNGAPGATTERPPPQTGSSMDEKPHGMAPVANLADRFKEARADRQASADLARSDLAQSEAAAQREAARAIRAALDTERILRTQLADELVAMQGAGGAADTAFCNVWQAIKRMAASDGILATHLARTFFTRSVVGPAFEIFDTQVAAGGKPELELLLGVERRRQCAAAWALQRYADLAPCSPGCSPLLKR